ncbi:MAG: hypothetical protein QOJ18_1420 [Microbacteriaceae bacterium]|nr:hypothetical protein [Microbacteriaceae bacterium]
MRSVVAGAKRYPWVWLAARDALELIETAHPRGTHYYLSLLGTDPSRRGHGYGLSLFAANLRLVDDAGAPADPWPWNQEWRTTSLTPDTMNPLAPLHDADNADDGLAMTCAMTGLPVALMVTKSDTGAV